MQFIKISLILCFIFILESESFPGGDKKGDDKSQKSLSGDDNKRDGKSPRDNKSGDDKKGDEKSPRDHRRKKEPRMEVLKVNGEGKALVVIIPADKAKNDDLDLKILNDKDHENKIIKTDDGLKLVLDDKQFEINTDATHKKGNFKKLLITSFKL